MSVEPGARSKEKQFAQELFDAAILPDRNERFVKAVLEIVDERLGPPALRSIRNILLLPAFELERKRLHDIRSHLKKTDRPKLEATSDERANLLREFETHFNKAQSVLDELIQLVENERANLSDPSNLDLRIMVADVIWLLKELIEKEIKRRRVGGVKERLSSIRRYDSKEQPSYNKQWKLVAELLNFFYKRIMVLSAHQIKNLVEPVIKFDSLVSLVETLESEIVSGSPIPKNAVTVQQYAKRYRKKVKYYRMLLARKRKKIQKHQNH